MFLRLRQLCLVAENLDPLVEELSAVFGVEVCHRDPGVAMFGLHNALLPFGSNFIEVVSPTQQGTAAGRYLERRKGDGGYMVILDTEELPRWRRHVAEIAVRIAAPLALDDYEGMQLHPRDTGGALLEINTTRGGANPLGAYWPAGPHWQQAVRTQRVQAITGAALQSDDPEVLARRWGQILQRPIEAHGHEYRLPVDNGQLRFVKTTDDRGEGLSGIDLAVNDLPSILATARTRGHVTDASAVQLGGIRFELRQAPSLA